MISRLPKWVELGAFILAGVAGIINVVGLLGFDHQSISHLSGTATVFGSQLSELSSASTLHLAGVLLSFMVGASISGFFLPGATLKLGRNYSLLLLFEGLLLLASVYLLTRDSSYGHYTASMACGIQNALATTYSGAVIRTTHVTGVFTDLGIIIGAKFRGENFDKRKALLLLLIIAGFILGGWLGAAIFKYVKFYTLLLPAIICLLLAVSYRFYTAQPVSATDAKADN